jgi:hypothetical protein
VQEEERAHPTAAGRAAADVRPAAHNTEDGGATTVATDPDGGAWNLLAVPLFDGDRPLPLRFALRRPVPGRRDDGARFLLQVDLSRLGGIQLDGRVQGRRLDLLMRSRAALAPDVRRELAGVFHDAASAVGLGGDIVFTTNWLSLAPRAAGARGPTVVRA